MTRLDNDALKEVFKTLRPQMVTEIDPDFVIDELISRSIITDDDYRDLRQVSDSRDRCRELLSLLSRSTHPKTFIQLRLALRKKYSWIVNEIDKRLKSLELNEESSAAGKFLLTANSYVQI